MQLLSALIYQECSGKLGFFNPAHPLQDVSMLACHATYMSICSHANGGGGGSRRGMEEAFP